MAPEAGDAVDAGDGVVPVPGDSDDPALTGEAEDPEAVGEEASVAGVPAEVASVPGDVAGEVTVEASVELLSCP